jgi:hypothetical protein
MIKNFLIIIFFKILIHVQRVILALRVMEVLFRLRKLKLIFLIFQTILVIIFFIGIQQIQMKEIL